MRTLKTSGGDHIREVLTKALALAVKSAEAVQFEFNERTYVVEPDDSYESAKARAEAILGGPILTADEESAQAAAGLERQTREWAEKIATAGVATEKQMRDADVPWLKTPDELSAYIAALVSRPHDYGTCVYAMSMAAVAAFHYVASVLGVTGFQASCADLDIVRRTRSLKGPFMIIDANDLLYPQYDVREKLETFIKENKEWCATEARKHIAENPRAHPNVRAHWDSLVGAVARTDGIDTGGPRA